jgi:archaellum component FlaC
MPKKEATINDVLTAINTFSAQVDNRFERVEKRLDGVEKRLDGVEKRLDGVEKRLDNVENRLDRVEDRIDQIEGTMVTKEYLDNALIDVRADFISHIKAKDKKVDTLIDILREKKVITSQESKKILAAESFV